MRQGNETDLYTSCTFVGPLAGLGQLALGEEGGEGDAAGEGLGVVQRAVQGQRRA